MSMTCCKVGTSLPLDPIGPFLVFLISLESFEHERGWDQVLSSPMVGAKCSRQLTYVESSSSNLSPLDSVMRLLVALERGSVGSEETLPVDHTLTIKLVRAYENR